MFVVRILMIEPDGGFSRLLKQVLERAGIDCDVCSTVAQGHYAQSRQQYGCAIVDRQLPDGDGVALVRRWRSLGNPVPCLLLSGRDAVADRIDGLDAGADDYLCKPFDPSELLARVRALLRRPPLLAQRLHRIGGLVVDTDALTATFDGVSLTLTAREFHVLSVLAQNAGQFVPRQRLRDQVFGHFSDVGTGGLDVALYRLRKKLSAAAVPVTIVNRPNVGYRLEASSIPHSHRQELSDRE
jgi:DNA-binding response OmpR family regulator